MAIPSVSPPLPPTTQNRAPQPWTASIAGFAARVASLRNMLFFVLLIISVIVFWTPLRDLLRFSLWGDNQYDKYSYTMAIPFIALGLVIVESRKIFASVQYGFRTGIILILAGLVLKGSAGFAVKQLGEGNALSAEILALAMFWLGGFILCYGVRAFRAGAFPLLFLILTVPVPDVLLDKPITAVQHGSTAVCSWVFALLGVPALRNGMQFTLSTVTIEVAKECSGIHSTIAIFIISLAAGHLFLSSIFKRVVLVLVALPIVCVTNGLRIAGLTLLSEYVNPSFLHGNLHHKGGMGFFVLALIFLLGILHLLRKGANAPHRQRDAGRNG